MRMNIFIAISTGLILSGCAYYAPTTRTQPPRTIDVGATVSISLTAEQAGSVRAYYSAAGTGNGRGRGGRLPPGIEKNLSRGKALPPGIAKQYLPAHLVDTLPVLPNGLEYLVAAGKLLLVEAATQIIRDVLLDAVA